MKIEKIHTKVNSFEIMIKTVPIKKDWILDLGSYGCEEITLTHWYFLINIFGRGICWNFSLFLLMKNFFSSQSYFCMKNHNSSRENS